MGIQKNIAFFSRVTPDDEQVATWRRGVVLEDGTKTQSADVRIESLAGKALGCALSCVRAATSDS